MSCRIFIGTDPGTKGACAVLAVADCPADEVAHGRVLAVEVFDLPVVARDNGGRDLDVGKFTDLLLGVLHRDPFLPPVGGGIHAVTERPQVGGSQRFGTSTLVTQAINVGAVWAVVTSIVGGMGGTSAWASGASKGGWRDEVNSQKGCEFIEAASVIAPALSWPEVMEGLRARPDRCVAVLLADVARRRWLGTAVAPKVTGTARAAKARKADRRREAIARAVAPLTVAKARVLAVAEHPCGWCPQDRGEQCTPRRRCCDHRLLAWAGIKKPDLSAAPDNNPMRRSQTVFGALLSMTTGSPMSATIFTVETWMMRRRTARSKDWTVTGSAGGEWTIPGEVGDVLIDHGVVQMDPGEKMIVYRPTKRGVGWSTRLRTELRSKEIAKPC